MTRSDLRILVVGFEPWDDAMYPHTRAVLEELRSHFPLQYLHLKERGGFVAKLAEDAPLRPRVRATLSPVLRSVGATLQAALRRQRPHVIMAIDAFAYGLVGTLVRGPRMVLWSHDLVTPDMPLHAAPLQRLIHGTARRVLTAHRSVIVQDEDRLELVRSALGVRTPLDAFLLPVCLPGWDGPTTSSPWSPVPRIIQCGGIREDRFSTDLLNHFNRYPGRYHLHFHGLSSPGFRRELELAPHKPTVSERLVLPAQLSHILRGHHLGFVGYRVNDLNHRMLANASGQLVEFLRLGMPVLVMGNTTVNDLVVRHGVGVVLNSVEGLLPALATLAGDETGFRQRARDLFRKQFELPQRSAALRAWLECPS
ncbi:MAG: hypothetical protein AB2A00_00020 [Myxococcota bacterium]